MNRAVLSFLLLGLIYFAAIPTAHADSKREETARANWESLKKSIDEHDANGSQAFVGQTVLIVGGLDTYKPPLRLSAQMEDGNWFQIQIVPPKRNSRADRDVSRILKWKAALVSAELMGIVRSVDLTKKVIILEVISGSVEAST